jgi:hypothetical protein
MIQYKKLFPLILTIGLTFGFVGCAPTDFSPPAVSEPDSGEGNISGDYKTAGVFDLVDALQEVNTNFTISSVVVDLEDSNNLNYGVYGTVTDEMVFNVQDTAIMLLLAYGYDPTLDKTVSVSLYTLNEITGEPSNGFSSVAKKLVKESDGVTSEQVPPAEEEYEKYGEGTRFSGLSQNSLKTFF